MYDWQDFFNHVPSNLDAGTYRIFEPQWKAEILHWVGREDVAKEQKEEFIKALVDFDDNCGNYYRYRAYFLASEVIAQFKDCRLADAIVEQLLKWSYAYFRQDKRDWKVYPETLVNKARVALEATDRERVIAAFVQLVHTTESRTVLRLAAQKLGQLNPGNKTAIAALVLLIQVTQDESILLKATRSLMKIDPDNPAGIFTLVKLTQSNPDGWSYLDRRWWIIQDAADALGEIGKGNETAIKALVQLIQTTKDKITITCEYATRSLGAIGTGNETAINALVQLMQTTANKLICEYAIRNLGSIAKDSEIAIAALVEFLQINQGDRICFDAAKALWQIDLANAAALDTLVQILETTQDGYLLRKVATYLRQIEPDNKAALSALAERIETSQDEYLRCSAAASLVEVDPSNIVAIATLSKILETTQYEGNLQQAAYSLVQANHNNQLALNTLFQLIQNLGQSPRDPEYAKYITWAAIQSLEKVAPSHQLAVDALVHLISTAQDDAYLDLAVRNLGRLGVKNEAAIAALSQLIASTDNDRLLCHAAWSLGKIDPGNQIAITTLIHFMQTFQEFDNNETCLAKELRSCKSRLLNIADDLKETLQSEHLPQVVIALKDYLGKQFYKHSCYRYEACERIIWDCAQKMSYPDFYKAWHK